ncbi:MAG: adenylate/guanylate cyclase domain-containing protein [Nocardioides sp.]
MAEIWVVVGEVATGQQFVPVPGRLHIGRECMGIAPDRRLLVDDPLVSRDHCEIRVEGGVVHLVDLSTNGTRLNGRRVERGERTTLASGDVMLVGSTRIELRVDRENAAATPTPIDGFLATTLNAGTSRAAVVVGDIVGYTRLTEQVGGAVVAAATDELFGALRTLVIAHGGLVSNYAGDAMLSAWDLDADPEATARAVACAVASAKLVDVVAAGLPVKDAEGRPLRMGWAVTSGEVATGRPSPGREAVLGDSVILAFRLSGIAARGEQPAVLVAAEVASAAPNAARYGEPIEVAVKGRSQPATVLPAS